MNDVGDLIGTVAIGLVIASAIWFGSGVRCYDSTGRPVSATKIFIIKGMCKQSPPKSRPKFPQGGFRIL